MRFLKWKLNFRRVLRIAGRVFPECPSIFLMLFSWLDGSYRFVGITEVMCWSQHIISTVHAWVSLMMLTLIMWPVLCLSIFSTVKLCPLFFVAFILKDSFSRYRVLGWHLFSLIPLTRLFHCLSVSFQKESLLFNCIVVLLKISHFFVNCCQDFVFYKILKFILYSI